MISSIKKISSKLKWHLSTSWITSLLLAAVPTMLIVLAFPVSPEKYIANKVLIKKYRHCWYYDLESDGEKEMISLDHNPDSTIYIRIRNEYDELLGQYNLENSRAFSHNLHRPTAIDINTDGVKELLLFTQKKDSLFLNTFDYTIPGVSGEKRFITTIGGLNDKHDYRVNNLASYDATGDGIEEYFFSVSGGFALYPRRIFRYDFDKDSLVCSINTGSSYLQGEAMVSEGDFTLFVSSAATGNFPADHKIPYPDSCSRIFFFDKDLEMIREPVAFGSYPSGVPRFKIYMETVFVAWGEEEKEFWVSKFSLKGDLIESVPMGNSISNRLVTFFDYKGDTLVYVENKGKESKYILQPERYREKGDSFLSFLNGGSPRFQEDLDGDGLLSSFLAYDMKGEERGYS